MDSTARLAVSVFSLAMFIAGAWFMVAGVSDFRLRGSPSSRAPRRLFSITQCLDKGYNIFYEVHTDTAVHLEGTGGDKLMLADYGSEKAYLKACRDQCNADSTCGGFVDDPTDVRGRMCKPKLVGASGYGKASKTFHVKTEKCGIPVRVAVLRKHGGVPDSTAPWTDTSAGTMPLDSDGGVHLQVPGATLATSLSTSDVKEIFTHVNELYHPVGVAWDVETVFVEPTVTPERHDTICDDYKCRTHDYFVKYWGTVNKILSQSGRTERPAAMFSLFPEGSFQAGGYNVAYVKYVGTASQGVMLSSRDTTIAGIGEWSDKFSRHPAKRPNRVACGEPYSTPEVTLDERTGCLFALSYTTAHELGHLLSLRHNDLPSIMEGGGFAFSQGQEQDILSWLRRKDHPKSNKRADGYGMIAYSNAMENLQRRDRN